MYAQQNGQVTGTITDTVLHQPVTMATVSLVKRTDSALVSFTMTDREGKFRFTGIADGTYRLLITHISYHNSNRYFDIDKAHKNISFHDIVLTDVAKQLDDVTVSAEAPPITLKGDSIEYNAGSFKTQPNAVVEDLLKKLPGVQVEKDGTVKAQGQTVSKVYVDGKEFFGNDPKIATKNLPADAVDKVQVFDKQSDMAQLTGFDDGNSEKAINLKLKKDKKKNTFGKITAGAGTNNRYENRVNVNAFKGARQFTAIGIANNTNAEGFSFMDLLKFSGALNNIQGNGGNISINIQEDDPNAGLMGLSGNQNKSINTAWAGGLNYSDIIGNNTNFNTNYLYSHLNPKAATELQREYILPDSSYFYRQFTQSNNDNNNHRLNLVADIRVDSFTSLKISPSFGLQHTENISQNTYRTYTTGGVVRNDGLTGYTSNADVFNFKNELLLRKKFNKRGRTISLLAQYNHNDSKGDGRQNSLNNFYDESGYILQKDTLNQQFIKGSNYNNYTLKAAYTEPVFKRSLLEISVTNGGTNAASNKQTFDFSDGKYDQLNTALSNNFKTSYGFFNEGIKLRTQKKKYNYALGLSLQQAKLDGLVRLYYGDSLIQKQFHNLLPNASFQYNFTKFKNLNLRYNTTVTPPSVSQLQPVPDVSNPLHIIYGNPQLQPELSHRIQVNFVNINPFKGRHAFIFAAFTQTQDKIIYADSIDPLFIQSSKPVNVNGVFTFNGDASLGFPLRKIKGTLELAARVEWEKNRQLINAASGNIQTVTVGPQVRVNTTPYEKLSLFATAELDHTFTKYALQPQYDVHYFTQQYGVSADWQLPKYCFFSTEINYMVNGQAAPGYNKNVWLWNASVSKQFLKFNRGEIRFSAKDLLNQNIGFSRTSNPNYIEQQQSTILRRFFLLSFTYNLSKTGAGQEKGGGDIRIMAR